MSRALAPVRAAAGFTLLEAIVAMAVMATSLMALYAWLGTSAIALSRVQASAQQLEDARSVLALIETINPMAEPRGERRIESLRLSWRAEPLTERRFGVSRAGGLTAFDLALYEVTVEVVRDRAPVRTFRVRRAGWENARPFDPEQL